MRAAAVLLAASLSMGCRSADVPPPTAAEAPAAREAAPEAATTAAAADDCPPPQEDDGRLVLAFAGDVIAHDGVREAASRARGGYGAVLAGARGALAGVDLAFANLESPVATRTLRRGSMIFNAEEPLLEALAKTGFDVLSVANNHAFDQGRSGLADTLAATARRGFATAGAGATRAEACAPTFIERRGFRVAVLARTLVMNFRDGGVPGEPDVCMYVQSSLARAARAARAAGADLVIASVHWGNEYEPVPRREQIDAARHLVAAGVDIVFGHHPHVLQPVERVQPRRGRSGVVAYSLGNLLSNQGYAFDERTDPARAGDTRDGAILYVVASKGPEGVTIDDVVAAPLWTEHGIDGEIAIVPAGARRERVARALRVPLVDAPPRVGARAAPRACARPTL